jgi:hypothetical protein
VPVCGALLQLGPSANSPNHAQAAQNERLIRRKPIAYRLCEESLARARAAICQGCN